MGRPNVQDLPSDPEILPDVAGCSTTQSDSGNISQSNFGDSRRQAVESASGLASV